MKILAESKLTDRYQTTVPSSVRDALSLDKQDKIAYEFNDNGTITISRVSDDDPILTEFLNFISDDIRKNRTHIKELSPSLVKRAQSLVQDIEVDLDAPLDEED